MRKVLTWILSLAAVAGVLCAAYLAWLYWRMPETSELAEYTPVEPPPALPSPALPPPKADHTIVAEPAPAVAVTTVDDSDSIFSAFVKSLFKAATLPEFIYSDRMLRRFVATVDNLPRKDLAARIRPVKPAQGLFLANKGEGTLSIAPENSARYERYVRALESIDVAAMVKFYATHYALFQKAYQDLGYPTGHFNNRLFEAIDDLLATPQLKPPVDLIQPKVLYRYADPELENRSAGQKIMLRMGPDNSQRVKTVLQKVRAELQRYETRR